MAEDVQAGHRYYAARAAVQAAAGKVEDRESARLRQQALRWLSAQLTAAKKLWQGQKPLDMLFVAGDGRIIRIAQRTQPHSLEQITSMGPVVAVIEIAGVEAARLGIATGARVRNAALKNAPP